MALTFVLTGKHAQFKQNTQNITHGSVCHHGASVISGPDVVATETPAE